MTEDRRDEVLRHFPTLLARWRGVSARLWELTKSHPTLRITLCEDGRSGSLEIACLDPEHISAPLRWEDSDIHVEKAAGDGLFDVVDERARVRISSCGVEIAEFDKKPYERR